MSDNCQHLFFKVKLLLGLPFENMRVFISWQRRGGDTKGNLAWESRVPVAASFLAERIPSDKAQQSFLRLLSSQTWF